MSRVRFEPTPRRGETPDAGVCSTRQPNVAWFPAGRRDPRVASWNRVSEKAANNPTTYANDGLTRPGVHDEGPTDVLLRFLEDLGRRRASPLPDLPGRLLGGALLERGGRALPRLREPALARPSDRPVDPQSVSTGSSQPGCLLAWPDREPSILEVPRGRLRQEILRQEAEAHAGGGDLRRGLGRLARCLITAHKGWIGGFPLFIAARLRPNDLQGRLGRRSATAIRVMTWPAMAHSTKSVSARIVEVG